MSLGLAFMRGFVTIFDQQQTGFATVNKANCFGSDDLEGIGTVEWAPEVHHDPKRHFTFLVVCIIIMGIVIVISLAMLIVL